MLLLLTTLENHSENDVFWLLIDRFRKEHNKVIKSAYDLLADARRASPAARLALRDSPHKISVASVQPTSFVAPDPNIMRAVRAVYQLSPWATKAEFDAAEAKRALYNLDLLQQEVIVRCIGISIASLFQLTFLCFSAPLAEIDESKHLFTPFRFKEIVQAVQEVHEPDIAGLAIPASLPASFRQPAAHEDNTLFFRNFHNSNFETLRKFARALQAVCVEASSRAGVTADGNLESWCRRNMGSFTELGIPPQLGQAPSSKLAAYQQFFLEALRNHDYQYAELPHTIKAPLPRDAEDAVKRWPATMTPKIVMDFCTSLLDALNLNEVCNPQTIRALPVVPALGEPSLLSFLELVVVEMPAPGAIPASLGLKHAVAFHRLVARIKAELEQKGRAAQLAAAARTVPVMWREALDDAAAPAGHVLENRKLETKASSDWLSSVSIPLAVHDESRWNDTFSRPLPPTLATLLTSLSADRKDMKESKYDAKDSKDGKETKEAKEAKEAKRPSEREEQSKPTAAVVTHTAGSRGYCVALQRQHEALLEQQHFAFSTTRFTMHENIGEQTRLVFELAETDRGVKSSALEEDLPRIAQRFREQVKRMVGDLWIDAMGELWVASVREFQRVGRLSSILWRFVFPNLVLQRSVAIRIARHIAGSFAEELWSEGLAAPTERMAEHGKLLFFPSYPDDQKAIPRVDLALHGVFRDGNVDYSAMTQMQALLSLNAWCAPGSKVIQIESGALPAERARSWVSREPVPLEEPRRPDSLDDNDEKDEKEEEDEKDEKSKTEPAASAPEDKPDFDLNYLFGRSDSRGSLSDRDKSPDKASAKPAVPPAAAAASPTPSAQTPAPKSTSDKTEDAKSTAPESKTEATPQQSASQTPLKSETVPQPKPEEKLTPELEELKGWLTNLGTNTYKGINFVQYLADLRAAGFDSLSKLSLVTQDKLPLSKQKGQPGLVVGHAILLVKEASKLPKPFELKRWLGADLEDCFAALSQSGLDALDTVLFFKPATDTSKAELEALGVLCSDLVLAVKISLSMQVCQFRSPPRCWPRFKISTRCPPSHQQPLLRSI